MMLSPVATPDMFRPYPDRNGMFNANTSHLPPMNPIEEEIKRRIANGESSFEDMGVKHWREGGDTYVQIGPPVVVDFPHDLTTVPEHAVLVASNDIGDSHTAIATRHGDGSIHVAIRSDQTGRIRFSMRFRQTPDGSGYVLDIPIQTGEIAPLSTSLFSFVINAFGIWAGFLATLAKFNWIHEKSQESPGQSATSHTSLFMRPTGFEIGGMGSRQDIPQALARGPVVGLPPTGGVCYDEKDMCINHDMICSFGLLSEKGNPIAKTGGRYLKFSIPYFVDFKIDLIDCCENHDINLWCAESRAAVAYYNELLIKCFQTNIVYQTWEQLPLFWKLLGFGTFLGLLLSFNVVLEILAGIGIAIGEATTGDPPRDIYYNFDKSQGHQKSCLCGGNVPTYVCDSPDSCRICETKNSRRKRIFYGGK
jgi:hypothetical protein